jgi:hypothetical protein
VKGRRKRAGQFQYGIAKNIDDQGRPPSDAIRHPTEEESTEWPEGEREDERFCYSASGNAEICRNSGYTKDKNEKVECVERPAEETGGERVTLPRSEIPEWGKEIH